jgi:Protein of unknown function (DUF1553)/Protein of unknown function (DUF1549)
MPTFSLRVLFAVCVTVVTVVSVRAEPPKAPLQKLIVYPDAIDLTGPRDEQQLGVLGEYADGRRQELSREAAFKSGDAKIVTIDAQGIVRPVKDGQTTLTITANGVKAKVKNAAAETPVSFTREVVPVLTRAGCNAGSCHGAALGRGGFKLSLFGFDPAFDHQQIVQSNEGRRVVPSDPERSILLLKPTLVMEHQGGQRFTPQSRSYDLLKRWLEDGAPEPSKRDPHVERLEVWPAQRILVPGESQQLLVRAVWSDKTVVDVTTTAQFDALNEAVTAVTPNGLVTAKSRGETHIMIRYMGQATVAQVTLPFASLGQGLPTMPQNKPLSASVIDVKLAAKWNDLGLTPSPRCSDEEFVRRLTLDAIGTLPTPKEVRDFLADKSANKRQQAVERVLERPEFVDFWTLKWGDLLRINRDTLQDKGMWSFHNWVRAALRDNKPVDEMVRDIITAEGSPFTDGPANFYMNSRQPTDWSETTAQLFLGVRMQCAKCHHHPFEKWSQDDYYGLTAFFGRVGTKTSQEFGLFGRETVLYLKPTGEVTHPRKGGVVKPHPLDGPDMDDPFDRRRKLAEWLTTKENPFFARNLVNRFWAYTMGHGLVEPIDDMRATNPASNPELLDALAADFARNKFDLKSLLRTIFTSEAYQLSADRTPGNAADVENVYHTRYERKRLSAEQLADAVDFATGTQEKYQGVPLGTRAIQLPDTKVRSYLMDVFGRPARQITCECERTSKPNIASVLHLLNGDFINKKIDATNGRVEALLKAKTPAPAIIEELYLVTLSRLPRPEEIEKSKKWIAQAPTPREGVADLLWTLLNSREFLFNH